MSVEISYGSVGISYGSVGTSYGSGVSNLQQAVFRQLYALSLIYRIVGRLFSQLPPS